MFSRPNVPRRAFLRARARFHASPPGRAALGGGDHGGAPVPYARHVSGTDAALETDAAAERPRGLRGLYERFRHLIHELGKFGTVGLVAFAVDTVLFNLLRAR